MDLDSFDRNTHGISGWWACGFISSYDPATVLVSDTWNRGLMIADETTTKGFMFLTASGPVGDYSRSSSWSPIAVLYDNLIEYVIRRDDRMTLADSHA